MEIQIDNDADTIRAGSTVAGHVHLFPTMVVPPGSTIHVVFDGKEQCEIMDRHGDVPTFVSQNHSLLRLDTTCTSGRRFSIDIPKDLPNSMFVRDGGSCCGITYTLQAYLPNSNIISIPKPIRLVAMGRPVDSTLTVTVGDVVPLMKSQLCGLWETPIKTYSLATSPEYVTINPGQTLSIQLDDPNKVLPTTQLNVKLNQRISWSAQGFPHGMASSWTLPINGKGEIVFPKRLHQSSKGRLIQVDLELLASLNDNDGKVVASTAPIRIRIVHPD